ncbi:Nif3-like dinuclear metal center hexameric protein [Bifidobacterium callimiconis]|uniref:GTP cyclohydrolase 1 type 2 homolog n=1 Tax=Bifidobacterium callimiconis TaxID=2306973 RepID=A0A430FI61_9BIFI|nr:Nif3-like dinuclear metal center hexameric protein [Bifidobacterium callimiconis]MBT1176327.1 Nif3-like dinuclear metal center hexameric protein [Bifidobacterium callimiconis]RSX52549.1 Nif3-like dinuclear metal center hexameric protein [Bifidobacterium callimiconis]
MTEPITPPTLKQVIDVLETLYPLRYAESWDEPGLIVGDLARPVRRIYCAVDPTHEIVAEAVAYGADLLITHHPLFFRSVHQISGLGFRGDIVNTLIANHCGLWVGHTNADSAHRGTAHAFADRLGLINQRPLEPITDPTSEHPVGLGRIGELPEPVTLRALTEHVAELLPHTELGIQVAGDPDQLVRTVATLPGSGDSMFDEVRASGADVYITSDLRHHPATDAWQQALYEAELREQGFAVGQGRTGERVPRPALINTPHSAIERSLFHYLVPDVTAAIRETTGADVEIALSETSTDPWTFRIG